jgi:diadenosine tetraphosphatase ApaH/serine/threonine PP2A family protein phosphatase
MKYAIITDIHSNLEALTSVFQRIDAECVDEVLCLGDLVGYHANPNECVTLIRERGVRCITGNHDRAAAGLKEPVYFSEAGRRAILWTRRELTEDSLEFLKALPVFEVIGQRVLIVHAGVHPHPNEDVRLNSGVDVIKSFDAMIRLFPDVKVCFVGHAHRSLVYQYRDWRLAWIMGQARVDGHRSGAGGERAGAPVEKPDQLVSLEPSPRYLVNPGSVGQSRDGDPRAAFLIYDDLEQTLRFHRVEYDWELCYRKAEQAGLLYKETRLRKSVNWITARIAAGENMVKRTVARRFL